MRTAVAKLHQDAESIIGRLEATSQTNASDIKLT